MINKKIRFARPTDNLNTITKMYIIGLGFKELFSFKDHNGFDGIIIGHPDHIYHFEFTSQKKHIVGKCPNKEHLIVFYIPDKNEWIDQCQKMLDAGFKVVKSFNPYWDNLGKTFEDIDGYRVVLQNQNWD
jgi:hypothetical protein